jgi:hypothetical protein
MLTIFLLDIDVLVLFSSELFSLAGQTESFNVGFRQAEE